MRIIGIVFIFIASFAQAQVSLSVSQLDFGDVETTVDKELAVNVTNTSSGPLVIDDVNIYNTDFTYTISKATIATGATEKIRVTFKPRHNVMYNTELIFVLDDGSEHRIDLIGNGRYEGTYYSSTFNKSYQDLKDALKTTISTGYVSLSYNVARDNMYADLDNVGGKVTGVYTGRVATMSTRADANNNSINCEHTWPQSKFNSQTPEKSDIHHLFPTDNSANSKRGSYAFGVVTNPSWEVGGSKQGGSLFEPRDLQKGATARAMMYFVLRYKDWGSFFGQQEAILKQWHSDFIPSAAEIQRNNKIFALQKNRNPFVDHPEFMERINVLAGSDTKPVVKNAATTQNSLNFKFIDPSDERSIYIVNTGNQDLANISSVSARDGNVTVNSVESSAGEGEAAKVTLGFKNLSDGTYNDELTINLQDQVGKTITLPIAFTIGTASQHNLGVHSIKTSYNPMSRSISILDAPAGVQEIEIWDVTGKQVLLNDISTTLTDIPFSGHSNGVYFVVVKSETEVYSSKILVY